MSLLSDIYNKMRGNKTNVTLTPETPVKKPEVLLTVKKPVAWPQADQNKATLNKIVPGRSLLSQVAEKQTTPAPKQSILSEYENKAIESLKKAPKSEFFSEWTIGKSKPDTSFFSTYSTAWDFEKAKKRNIVGKTLFSDAKNIITWTVWDVKNIVRLGLSSVDKMVESWQSIFWLAWEASLKTPLAKIILPKSIEDRTNNFYKELQKNPKWFLDNKKQDEIYDIAKSYWTEFWLQWLAKNPGYAIADFIPTLAQLALTIAVPPAGIALTWAMAGWDINTRLSKETESWLLKRVALSTVGWVISGYLEKIWWAWVADDFFRKAEWKELMKVVWNSFDTILWKMGLKSEGGTEVGQDFTVDAASYIWGADFQSSLQDYVYSYLLWEWSAKTIQSVWNFIRTKNPSELEDIEDPELAARAIDKNVSEKKITKAEWEKAKQEIKKIADVWVVISDNKNITKETLDTIKNNYNQAEPNQKAKVLVDGLKSFWYNVEYTPAKTTNSEYLTIAKKWATEGDVTTIRLSDHGESKQRVAVKWEKDFLFDKNSKIDLPIKDIIAKIEEGEVPEIAKPDYKDSEMVKAFNNRIDRFSNEELASYAISQENPAQLQNNARDELARRTDVEEEMRLYDTVEPKKFEWEVQTVVDTTVPSDLTTLSDNQLALLETNDPAEQDAIVTEYQRRGISDEQWIELQSNATPEARTVETKKLNKFYTWRWEKISDFSTTKSGSIFFTKNKDVAKYYAGDNKNITEADFDTSNFLDLSTKEKRKEYVKKAFVAEDIEKMFPNIQEKVPLTWETKAEFVSRQLDMLVNEESFTGGEKQKLLLDKIKAEGYPWVILKDTMFWQEDTSYVVFDKSIINTGKLTQPKESLLNQYIKKQILPTSQELKARKEWFTYDPQDWGFYEAGKTDGIAVTPFPNRSEFIPGEKGKANLWKTFKDYVRKNEDLIRKWMKVWGFWSDDRGGYVLDVTVLIPPSERAFAEQLAKDTNQESIFDLSVDPNNGYISTGWTGLVPEWFDENNILNIITPYLSNQPSYASTSNIVAEPSWPIWWTTWEGLRTVLPEDWWTATEELTSPFWETTNIPKDSPLVYKPNESTFEKKSGYEIDTTNVVLTWLMVWGVAATTMIPFVWPAIAMTVWVSLSPIAIIGLSSPKTFDTLFFKQRVLNAFRDENGITALHAVTNEDTNNLFRIKNFIDEFGMQKHIDVLAENEKWISDAFDTVWENIDWILSEDTFNLLSGDKLWENQKQSIKNIFIASIGSNNFRKLFLDFNTEMAIKKFMAIENLYRYQPWKVKAILKSVAPELIPLLERQWELLADIDKGYTFWYDALVEWQILTSKDDSDRYVRYLVLAETYKYDYKKWVNDTQGYDNLFELLAAKELEYSLADDQKRADMQSEITRLRTSILKEKSDDVMDVYRVHSPLAQFLDYAVNYSETVTRKQKLEIIEKINELDPVAVGTKKVLMSNIFNVTLIDDMFFPNKVNLPSLVEIERANKLYGIAESSSLEIQKHNLWQKILWATVDVLWGALKWAYWMIGWLAQVSQGIYSVVIMNSPGLIKSWVRIVRFGTFQNTENTGKFFMQNKLSARHTQKNLTSTNAIEQIRMRNEYSKFGINAVYRTSGNIGSTLDASSQFFFGWPAEVSISEHVIMNEIFALMDAKNPGKYQTKDWIDAQKVMDDFNELPQWEKNKELARLRTLAQSLYDGITDSNSGISLFRVPFMKFFNRFVSSSASQAIGRFADVRSLLRDTMKSPSVKEAIKTFSSDKNKAYRAAWLKVMSIVITASVIMTAIQQMLQSTQCERWDEECEKKQKALSYTVFNRMFGISMQKAILSAIGWLPSTPFGFYDKLIFNFYEFVQWVVTDNESMKSIALTNIINSLGFIKNVVNLATDQKMGVTSYMNATELTNTDFSYWFSHNVSRWYSTPGEKVKVWDAMAKNPDVDFDGLYVLMNQANKVSDLEYTDSFNGIARLLNTISPALAKLLIDDNTITETEDFVSERTTAVNTFEDVRLITHAIDTTEGSLLDITEAAALAIGAQNNPWDLNYISQISKNFSSMRKKNVDIAQAFDSSFRAFGMTITASDLKDWKAMIEKMKRSPYIYASYLKSIQTLSESDNKYDWEEDLKKLFSTGLKSTDPIYDAIAYQEQAPEYANTFASSLKKSMWDTYIKGSKEEATQKLSTLEAYLQIGAGSDLLSWATLRWVQIAMWSQFESNILDLTEKWLYSPIEYPHIAEAVIALVDARSIKPVKATDIIPKIDMYKAAKNPQDVVEAEKNTPKKITPVENYEGTTIEWAVVMSIEWAAWNHGIALVNKKGSPVYTPVSWVVVDTGYTVWLWNTIKIQDYNGNVLQYSNLDGYNAKTGDFIVQGYQVGKMKWNIAQATLFSKDNEILSPEETTWYMNTKFTAKSKSTPTVDAPPVKERKTLSSTPWDSRFRHSSARQDWTLWDTPVNEIVKRELENIMNSDDGKKIDFAALSSKIKSKSKTKKVWTKKPKSVPSVMEAWLNPNKSFLEMIAERSAQ